MPIDINLMARATIAFERLMDEQRQINLLQSRMTGTPMRAISQKQEEAIAVRASTTAMADMAKEAERSKDRIKRFQEGLVNFGMRAGLGITGLAAAASPALGQTLISSFEQLAGEIGLKALPAILDFSFGLQKAARFVQGMDDKGGIANIARTAMGFSTGMTAARFLGLGGPLGIGAGILGAGLSRGGIEQLKGPAEKTVELLGKLADAMVPFAQGSAAVVGLIVRPLTQVADLLSAMPVNIMGEGGATVATTLGGVAAGAYLGSRIGGPTGAIAGGVAGGFAGAGLGPVGTGTQGSSLNTLVRQLLWGPLFDMFGYYAPNGPGAAGAATGSVAGRGPTLRQQLAPSVSTGFVSRQISIESMRDVLQQEMVRDQQQQDRFERQMRVLQEMSRYLSILAGPNTNNLVFNWLREIFANQPAFP